MGKIFVIILFAFILAPLAQGFAEIPITPITPTPQTVAPVPPAPQFTIIKVDDKVSKQLRRELIGTKKKPGTIPKLQTTAEETKTAADGAKISADATKDAVNKAVQYGGIGLLVLLSIGIVSILLLFRTGRKVDAVSERVENTPFETAKLIQKEVLLRFTVDETSGTFRAPILANGAMQVLHLKENGTLAYFFKQRDAARSLRSSLKDYLDGASSKEQIEVIEQAKSSGRLEMT